MRQSLRERWTRYVARLLIRGRWPLLVVAVVTTALIWLPSRNLQFDRSLTTSVAEDTPYVEAYRESRRIFGAHDAVIVGYVEPRLFRENGYELTGEAARRLDSLAERLKQVKGVVPGSVYHIGDALQFRFRTKSLVGLLEGMLIGADHETVAVVLSLEDSEESPVSREQTVAAIRDIARNHEPRAYIAGEPVIVEDTFRYIGEDGKLLFRVSLGLLGLVSLVLFRGIRWVILPVAVVFAAIIWTRGLLAVSGVELSMVSSMLDALVTIIAVATVMHMIVQFRIRQERHRRVDAFHRTGKEIGPAIFWTCATTAAGFAALLSSSIHPVRSFALMMTLGVALVFVSVISILPGGFLIGSWNQVPQGAPGERKLLDLLGRLGRRVDRHPWGIGLAALALAVGTGLGLTRLEVQSDPTKNFRESSPIVQALEFIETRLGGTGDWEVNFPAPENLSSDYLRRVESLCAELRAVGADGGPALTKVNSLTDWVGLIPQVPFFLNTFEKRLNLLESTRPEVVGNYYNAEAGRMRILLRSRQVMASEKKIELIEHVREIARERFPEAEVTGSYVLMARTVEGLIRDQLVSLGLATAGMVLMFGLAFRSIGIGLISIVPNLFPIVLVVGTMGWIGMPVNMGTAMIAAVSMGLTVDGTIHYIAGYRRARRNGLDRPEALAETHRDVGRALLFATIALVIGFSVLSLSHFVPLMHFGILVSFTMGGGLLADLILLPLLLRFTE